MTPEAQRLAVLLATGPDPRLAVRIARDCAAHPSTVRSALHSLLSAGLVVKVPQRSGAAKWQHTPTGSYVAGLLAPSDPLPCVR